MNKIGRFELKVVRAPLIIFFLLGIVMFTAVSSTHAIETNQNAVGTFTPTDCFFDGGVEFITAESLGFRCGFVTVPEQHDAPDGPTIRIPVAIRDATGIAPRPDPLFLAQGGPGGDAFGVFGITAPTSPVASDRDIVIFNQRGTLYAEPDLLCEELWDSRIELFGLRDEEAIEQLGEESFQQCYNRLLNEENINLSAFDSLENAKDVDIIRQALGYDTYNFYGVSYGTLLGLHLMQLNQPALRAVVLDSVVPTQISFAEAIPQSENRAYDEYFAFCEEDATCREMYPDLETRLTAVYANLNENPVEFRIRDDETGESVVVQIDGDGMRGIMFQLFYLGDFYAIFPRLVEDLESENYLFLQNLYPLFAFDRTIANGMYFSVFCAQYSDFSADNLDLTGIRPFIADSIASEMEELEGGCDVWEVEPLPSTISDPVESDIPVLLLSGRFDPITPPSFAAAAAETLPNGFNYVDPAASHGVALGVLPCGGRVLADFLNEPTEAPNTGCFENVEYTEIVTQDAIQIPIFLKLANLDTNTAVQFVLLIVMGLGLLTGLGLWPAAFLIRRLRGVEKSPAQAPQARLFSRILVLIVGVLVIAFVGGFIFFAVQIFGNNAMLTYGAYPGSARPLFFLIPLILLLALGAIALLVRSWGDASTWGKVYHVFLIICLGGISVFLFTLRFFEPIWV